MKSETMMAIITEIQMMAGNHHFYFPSNPIQLMKY